MSLASSAKARDSLSSLAIVAVAAYAGLQMLSDVASLKIGVVMGFAVDMGAFIYPFTFTLRDLAHKLLGRRGVRTLVIATAVLNLFMALYLAFCAHATPDAAWDEGGANAHFKAILGPVWRIVVASIVAEVVSELADTEVYHWFRSKTPRFQWARVLLSNAVSIPLDNLIFSLGAFAGLLPLGVIWQIFLANLAVKAVVGIAGAPLIYLVPDRLERTDASEQVQG
ncbi:MAG: queuosine precursor transporter [Kiritimatiellia bacterium]|jgi:uncharacterized integral membrane protein (TIGR00697 family)